MSNPPSQVVIIHDFHYTLPTNGAIINLLSGESYQFIEKKSENWLTVSSCKDNDILFVPSSYAELVSSNANKKKSETTIKEKPPPPPVKPKHLLERLQSENNIINKSEPPIISKEALKELYDFLTRNYESINSPVVDEQESMPLVNCPSIESLDVFSHDEENLLMPLEAEINMHPKIGDIPLKIFDDGFEMYRDSNSGQVYYYDRANKQSSWTYSHSIPLTANPPSEIQAVQTKVNNQLISNFNGLDVFMPVEADIPKSNSNNLTSKIPEINVEQYANETEQAPIIIKSGSLNRTKITESGRRIKKNWNTVFVVLAGNALFFYKDQKASNAKSKHDLIIDLNTAFAARGNTLRSSRPNLIQLICGNGVEYLLQSSNAETINHWFELISARSNPSNVNAVTEHGDNNNLQTAKSPDSKKKSKKVKEKDNLSIAEVNNESNNLMTEKSKFSNRLKFWITRRPTRESLREKGIYKAESIFGSNLASICEKEKSTIPKFVVDCISAVEERGLTIDGIYRVSGNMAEVQKLRFAVNQNADYNLKNPEFDIHIVTGSLKLFFRELSEPLFPFKTFNLMLTAMGQTDAQSKLSIIKDAIHQMPTVNKNTARQLFQHFLLVVQMSAENRMHYQNISIVFGPTLMWPEEKNPAADLAVSMVMQGQLVEFILKNYGSLF